jgi:hypothetical protein
MSGHGPIFKRRTAVLRERAAFLRKRAKEQGGPDAHGRSVAEASALEWALVELEKLNVEQPVNMTKEEKRK